MTKQARPMKLRNGSWGAAIQGDVHEDEIVTIRTKTGKEWDARVTKVVWSGERGGKPLSIVATKSVEPPPSRREEPNLPPIADGAAGYQPEDFPDDDKPFCEDEDDIPF